MNYSSFTYVNVLCIGIRCFKFFFNFSYNQPKQDTSFDDYHDTELYPFQEERYGQEEEDRQWDSGGMKFSPVKKPVKQKKLPSIPTTKSNLSNLIVQSGHYDQTRPTSTPTVRRRMPQVPVKDQNIGHNEQEFYYTQENFSPQRGASLPPTPTKNNKLIYRLTCQNTPITNSPRTGRQLPKPNNKQSNIKAKRAQLMKRTSSADYADSANDDLPNYYMRPGTMSAIENYNEDYNYAYQSIDNLPVKSDETFSVQKTIISDTRSSVNANYLQSKDIDYGFQDDYFYGKNTQNSLKKNSYNVIKSTNEQDLDLHESNSLIQQNKDSLELRDDELKDSFDTAVSSMNSSSQQFKTSPFYEYTTHSEIALSNSTPITTQNLDIVQNNILNSSQYQGDHHQTKAIYTTSQPVITVAQVHNHTITQTTQQRRQLKQQDSVDSTDFLQNQIANEKTNNCIGENDKYNENNEAYLDTQESIESYVEETEDNIINGKY